MWKQKHENRSKHSVNQVNIFALILTSTWIPLYGKILVGGFSPGENL
jgi:hypothetical protein